MTHVVGCLSAKTVGYLLSLGGEAMSNTEHTDLKAVELPGRDEMLRRLKTVIGDQRTVDDFFTLIVKNAGKKLNGMGIVHMFYLATAEYSQTTLPMMARLLEFQAKQFITALVDDEEVRGDALRFIDKIQADLTAKEAARPIPPRPELSEAEKASHMRHIKHLVSLYDALVRDRHSARDGYRSDGPNPYFSQTASGLFLEFYYGNPCDLWTPWGKWTFASLNDSDTENATFMERLTVRVEVPETTDNSGVHGPVYAILAIDGGETLPNPVRLTDRRQFTEYEPTKAEWSRLFAAN
jgi:hypothetical protein